MIDRFQAQMHAMQMLQRAQEVTANNLSNINTPGFKADKVFYRMFTEEIDGKSVTTSVPMNQIVFDQGILEQSGSSFDMAIKGQGFFVVEDEESGEELLTRNGRFRVDPDGYLRDERGFNVLGQGGPISLPELYQAAGGADSTQFEVATDGTVRMNGRVYDRLQVVIPSEGTELERRGGTYFAMSEEGEYEDDPRSQVYQGFFERGNVNTLMELTQMMKNSQYFESHQRILRTTDEMLSQAINKLGQY
jgi:flagellar basal-body rod protein FlgF